LPLTIEIQAIFVIRREHHGGLHGAATSLLGTGDASARPDACR
jgi:hypothetical protein